MSQDHTRLPPPRGEGQGLLAERIAHLEAALLHIAETDRHYRTPPRPHADGGLRGWAGHHAVWALTGQHGSYTGDDEVREALAAGQSLTEASVYGSSPLINEAHPPGGNSHEG